MGEAATAHPQRVGQPAGLPLSAHTVHISTDLDETRAWMRGVGDRSVKLTQVERPPTDITFNVSSLGGIGFAFDSYGASTRSDVERYSVDPFLVVFPIAGRTLISLGKEEVLTTPRMAAVVSPPGPLSLHYGAGTHGYQLRIDRELVETRLRQMLGGVAPKSFDFEMAMDLDNPAVRSWRSLVDLVVADLDAGDGLTSSPVAAVSFEKAIVDALLHAQPHNYSDRLEQTGPTARPRSIQRAINLIHDHCTEPLSTADIAEAVGLSARTLQEGFQTHVDMTPMAYLRRVRLHRIREQLRVSDPATTSVTRVALDWGMTHLGRFAEAYRVEFGEAPSQTLRLAH